MGYQLLQGLRIPFLERSSVYHSS